MIQYSRDALNDIADGIASFEHTEIIGIPENSDTYALMLKLGMLETLYVKLKPLHGRALRQLLRHLSAAQRQHEVMRSELELFFADHKWDSPRFVPYFSGLDAAEMCILQMHTAWDSFKEVFVIESGEIKGISDKLNDIANEIKHLSGRSKANTGKLIPKLPAFFVTGGVSNGKTVLTFREIREVFDFMSINTRETVENLARINPLDSIMAFR